MDLSTLGALVGGLGLFLLAVGMISDGLRLAAGESLRQLLGQWTRTPLRGIGSGALITGIVQSSSAVTVATIGFVNGNLLTMHQALGVVYGANIGTTMTGWLVAAVGFKIKVEVFALPLIGVGMLLKLTGSRSRRAAIGEAIAGFGLFFIGIDVLRGAFEGLAQGIDLAALPAGTVGGLALFVGAGFLMTVLTQSSSAAIAITLTAATGGVVGLNAAAAMVIGANVGTTSTALAAAIGATPNARRVAAAHVIFNGVTGFVALLILPVMLWAVAATSRGLGLESAPAVTLAIFHTLFNVLGVLLLWPMTGRLARFLSRRFRSPSEQLGRPRYLDATTAGTPTIALEAMRLELVNAASLARRLAAEALLPERNVKEFDALVVAVRSLLMSINTATARVERQWQSDATVEALSRVLRVSHQLDEAVDAAVTLVDRAARADATARYERDCRDRLTAVGAGIDPEALRADEHAARDAILLAAARGDQDASIIHGELDRLRHARRIVEQLMEVDERIASLDSPVAPPDADASG